MAPNSTFVPVGPNPHLQCETPPEQTGANSTAAVNASLAFASFICCWIMLFTASIGIFGNLITFYIFCQKNMRSSINVLLSGLALIDTALLLFGTASFFPTGIYSYLVLVVSHTYYYPKIFPFMSVMVVYVSPVALMAQTASVWALILITIERFLAVCYPFTAKQFSTVQKALLTLVILIALSIAYNVCRFWEYTLIRDPCSGILEYSALLRGNLVYQRIYCLYMYVFLMFFIPFTLLCCLNIKIVLGVQSAKRARKHITRQQKKEQSTTTMMLVIIVIFLVCNCLAFLLQIFEVAGISERIGTDLFYFLFDVSNLLVEINSSFNFLIYYGFSEKYRFQFRRIMRNSGFHRCFPEGESALNRSQRSHYSTVRHRKGFSLDEMEVSMILPKSPRMSCSSTDRCCTTSTRNLEKVHLISDQKSKKSIQRKYSEEDSRVNAVDKQIKKCFDPDIVDIDIESDVML